MGRKGRYFRNYASNFGGKDDQPVPNSSTSQQCVDKADLSGDDGIGQVVKMSAPNSDVYFFAPFFKPCISDAFKKR